MSQDKILFPFSATRAAVTASVVAMILFAAAPVMAAKETDAARTEARISDMHSKLKITAAEEDLWTKVAEQMRDNAKQMDKLTDARMANAATMNAVDDLKSYGEIAEEHATEIKNFTPVFSDLYDSLSDSQKAEADELFRHGGQHRSHHTKAE